MITFSSKKPYSLCDGISRRSFLQIGTLALGGLTMADLLRLKAQGAVDTSTHKAVIVVYLNGGPSQLDMFDMKPTAPAEFRGEFRPMRTNVPGNHVCELMPLHSPIANKYSILNGMQVITSGHSLNEANTGFARVRPPRPAFTSVVSRFVRQTRNDVPASISMSYDAGPSYLGARHRALSPNGNLMDDLRSRDGVPEHRTALLRSLDRMRRDIDANGDVEAADTFTQQALDLMTSTRIRDAMDLSGVPELITAKYGRQSYGGLSLLRALRLAEAGVSAITVYGPGNGRWDTHRNNFPTMRNQILPEYDQNIAAMINDLYAFGLDQNVLIAIYGEFGRTPRINRNAGRDHYPQSGFVQLVGGGLRMGQVIGDTGRRGDRDISRGRPYTIQNLLATIYHVLGIDPSQQVLDNFGRPQYLLEHREPIRELV